MTNECRVEAVITATPAQLDAIAAIVGTDKRTPGRNRSKQHRRLLGRRPENP